MAIHKQNKLIENTTNPSKVEKLLFLSSMNSYLGILKHFKSYKLRNLYISTGLSKKWFIYFTMNTNFTKFSKIKTPRKLTLHPAKITKENETGSKVKNKMIP